MVEDDCCIIQCQRIANVMSMSKEDQYIASVPKEGQRTISVPKAGVCLGNKSRKFSYVNFRAKGQLCHT